MMADVGAWLRQLDAGGDLTLPAPGGGETAARLRALADWGRQDLSLARLAEAHTDAAAILGEAGGVTQAHRLYGVWASDGPHSRVTATRDGNGWRIDGQKQYCSGSTLLDAALVTAHAEQGLMLFEVALDAPGVSVGASTWASAAFADTATRPVVFERVLVGERGLIGGSDWYLSRPGFWNGALGPAACWAGGAMALIDAATKLNKKNAHSRAHVGALQAIRWGLDALLLQAGHAIDADPGDTQGDARARALKVRHLIERWCTEVLDRFGRATGPELLAFDDAAGRQYAALALYIRQCHAERDLEAIATP